MGRMTLNFWSTAAHAIATMLTGWIHREQEAVVACQKEEIRALREMLGGKRRARQAPRSSWLDVRRSRVQPDGSASTWIAR
jgi:hypothetical protein